MQLTLESFKNEHPELYEEIRCQVREEDKHAALEQQQELQRLQEQNESLLEEKQTADRRRAILDMLEEAQLPPSLRTERFEQMCLAAPDDEAVASLIQLRLEDRGWLSTSAKPRSMEQFATLLGTSVHDGATFAAALR